MSAFCFDIVARRIPLCPATRWSKINARSEHLSMKKETLRNLVRFLFRTLARIEFYNLEYIPTSGPALLTTNHLSYVDTPLLFVNPVRKDITALVTDKYMNYPFLRWFTITAGGLWIDRDRADFGALSAAREVLSKGMVLGIA
ncbi:1-acyl-sn-glycerol-3-phosphate acyltransferase, partial [bacterium]